MVMNSILLLHPFFSSTMKSNSRPKMTKTAIVILLQLLLMAHLASGRPILGDDSFVSGGKLDQKIQYPYIRELDLKATNVTCEPTYGFLPCTTEVWGQLFLLLVYEYLLSLSGQYISRGSDLFFEMFGTGIFGASLFHMLNILPQVIIVLVSGITGSDDDVESVSTMNMGLLAGSAIMNLTIVWGSIIAFGSYNISGTSSTGGAKHLFSLTSYGVTTDSETKDTGRVMLLSIIPLLLLQLAKILSSSSAKRVVVLVTLIISLIYLVVYCIYQVFEPWIQNRRLEYLVGRSGHRNLLQILYNPNGKPDETIITELFRRIDQNNNTKISAAELRALFLGIQIEEVGLDEDDYATGLLEAFNVSGNSEISETEFVQKLSKWLAGSKSNSSVRSRQRRHKTQSKASSTSKLNSTSSSAELESLVSQAQKAKDDQEPVWWNYTKAAFLITIGTAISIVLVQPLMETIEDFSTAVSIPSFLVSYVVVPVALTFRQGYSAIASARDKTEKAVSLALSEIYGGVFMNNAMGLASFLFLVYLRNLSWNVSGEVLVVLIICSLMGLLAGFFSKFPAWSSILAYALYPMSLAFLYFLTVVLGWG